MTSERNKRSAISSFLKNEIPIIGPKGKEVQSDITDNENAKIVSSNGVIQGYNGITDVVEKNQVIIADEAFGRGQEQRLF